MSFGHRLILENCTVIYHNRFLRTLPDRIDSERVLELITQLLSEGS
jgi:hypothetical protein